MTRKQHELARLYARSYIKFLVSYSASLTKKDAYNSFRCVMYETLCLDCDIDIPKSFSSYYVSCCENLKLIDCGKTRVNSLKFLELCCVYAMIGIQYIAGR